MDRLSNTNNVGAKMVLMMSDGSILEQALKFGFKANDNETQYDTLLAKLRIVVELQVKGFSVHWNSMLIVNQF